MVRRYAAHRLLCVEIIELGLRLLLRHGLRQGVLLHDLRRSAL